MKEKDTSHISEDLVQGSERLFFFFGGIIGEIGMPPFEFYQSSKILDYSKIFLRDPYQSWYQFGLPNIGDNVFAIGRYLEKKIAESGASQITFVGNSMGGYAALLFCSMLQCGKAIAFSPQTFISIEKRLVYDDNRWRPKITAMHDRCSASDIYDLKPWIKERFPETQARVFVSDDDTLDSIHANELSGFPNIEIHRFADGGHKLVTKLRDDGHLAQILHA